MKIGWVSMAKTLTVRISKFGSGPNAGAKGKCTPKRFREAKLLKL